MQTFLATGDQVGSYRIESYVARGGMAVVYRALDLRLERTVALKVIAPDLAQNDRFRQRFMRESRLAAAIDHPNIIPIYEAGDADGVLYIAMRFVDGEDLSTLLDRKGPLRPQQCVPLFDQVAQALDAAHAVGLVHRDVKPANILLAPPRRDGEPQVYLTDFGLTKRSASLTGFTTVGHFLGTIHYVAPEQISNGHVDACTDVYSLGCVMYEAVTGTPPYPRDDDVAILWAHINDPPPSVRASHPELAAELDDVFAAALSKEPAGRPASCGALVEAFSDAVAVHEARAQTRLGSPASPAAVPQQAASEQKLAATPRHRRPAVAATPDAPAGSTAVARHSRRPPTWLFVGVVAVLVAVGAVVAAISLTGSGGYTAYAGQHQEASVALDYPSDWNADIHPNNFVVFSPPDFDAARLFNHDWTTAEAVARNHPEDLLGVYANSEQADLDLSQPQEVAQDVDQLLPTPFPGNPAVTQTGAVPGHQGLLLEGTIADPGQAQLKLHVQAYVVPIGGKPEVFVFFAKDDRFGSAEPTFSHVLSTVGK